MKYIYGVKYLLYNYRNTDYSIGVNESMVVYARNFSENRVKVLATLPFDYQLFNELCDKVNDINMLNRYGNIKPKDVKKLIK